MTLKDNLPSFIANEPYISEVLNSIQPEIDDIITQLEKILLECSISTCSVLGLQKYEKDYAIETMAELSIDERKANVINKMLAKRILTFEELGLLIKRNIDNKQFYVSNLAEEYKFKVMIMDEEYMAKLYNALYKARPAHLVFELILVSYERRCGTFSCNENTI